MEEIVLHLVLGGLHHDYQRRTARRPSLPPRCLSAWQGFRSCHSRLSHDALRIWRPLLPRLRKKSGSQTDETHH
jgi:hypothetical protein